MRVNITAYPKRYMPTRILCNERCWMNEWTSNDLIKHSLLAYCVLISVTNLQQHLLAIYCVPQFKKNCCEAATQQIHAGCSFFSWILFYVCIFGFSLKSVPLSKNYRFHLQFISSVSCFASLCEQFRCHALVKYSPDASSFNYTHIVI